MIPLLLKKWCVGPFGRTLAGWILPQSGFRVLNFHRVLPDDVPVSDYRRLMGYPTASEFDRLLRRLKAHFPILSLPELLRRRWAGGGDIALGITFDDGYLDVCTVAAPLLEKHSVPYTVFLTTDFIDGDLPWFSRMFAFAESARPPRNEIWLPQGVPLDPKTPGRLRSALATFLNQFDTPGIHLILDEIEARNPWYTPPDLRALEAFMTWDDVRGLLKSPLAHFEAHTKSHPNLALLEGTRLEEELLLPRRRIETQTERPCTMIAYPGGHFRPEVVGAAEAAGYEAGFLMSVGLNTERTQAFELHREYVSSELTGALFGLYWYSGRLSALRRWKRNLTS